MKKLLTLALALCFGVSAFAFDEGDNVTEALGLKATVSNNGEENPDSPFWQGFHYTEGQSDQYPHWEFTTYDNHVWGIYGIPTFNVYQDLTDVPAGIYTLKLQGFYRAGQLDTDYKQYAAGSPTKNLRIYVEVDGKEFSEYVMSICASGAEEAQFTAENASDAWMNDQKKGNFYVPTCHAAFQAFIDNGFYDQNELQFVVPEGAKNVRIGIRKDKDIAEDTSAWDNWRIYYDYAFDEEGLQKVAYAKFEKVYDAAVAFKDGVVLMYGALGGMLEERLWEYEDISDQNSEDEINAALEAVESIEAEYRAALVQIKSMDYLINVCDELIECTDFPEGKDDFSQALVKAKEAVESTDFESIDDYLNAANDLFDARVAYVSSQPAKVGEGFSWVDFSHAVSCSGLVNEKWTPFYNEAGEYVYPQEIEESWTMYHPNDGGSTEHNTYVNDRITEETLTNDGKAELIGQDLPDLASMAAWSVDTTDLNRWIYRGDKFKASVQSSTTLQWMKGYSSYHTGWTANPAEGELLFYQNVTSLPEGYYSVEGRVIQTAGAGSADQIKQYLFIQSGEEESKVAPTKTTNWGSYTRQDWEILETDMIYHRPGETVVLGYSMNCEAAVGGVILKFFGTDVDFKGLVEEAKQKVVTLLEQNEGSFKLLGDKPAVQALLDKVNPSDAIDDPSYKAALAILKEATDFINAAAAYNFNTQTDYLELQGQYKSEKEATILAVAAAYVDALAESETATYKDGQAADAMYKAYASYMKTFDQAEKLATEEINGILANQFANLNNYCDDADVLAQYELDLKNPIYKAIFANLHTEEATEANPVDVTVVLANPSFTEGVDGWDGTKPTQNEYARGNAEIWNQTTVDMYQKFQGLPAGKYKVTAQALYRDGAGTGGLETSYKNWQAANGDKEAWNAVNNYNAVLYAKSGRFEGKDLINSVCDTKLTAKSFDHFYKFTEDYGYPNEGKFVLEDEVAEKDQQDKVDFFIGYEDVESMDESNVKNTDGAQFRYPFDGCILVSETDSLFFPESMAGAALRFAQGEYKVEASVNVLPGEDLQLGIRKDAGTDGDWIIFDNFQLWYLGPIDESTPEPNPSANLLDDESYNFNKGTTGQWNYRGQGWNDGGTFANATPGYNGSAGALALTSKDPNGEAYAAQLLCNFKEGAKIERGNTYVVSFWAKGTVEGDIIAPGAGAWPNPEWNNADPAVLTTEWKQYTYTFEANESNTAEDGNTNIYFNQGKLTGTAYVDRVLVYDAREEINPDGNFIVDDESFAFNGGTMGEWKPSPWNTNDGKATAAVAQPGWNNSNACIAVKNTEKNGQGLYYQGQTQYTLPQALEMGKHYTATFYAKADEGFEGEFQFSAEATWAAGVTKYQYTENFTDISEDWTLYTIDFEVPTKAEGFTCEDLTTISLNYGMMVGQVYIDHIVILETPSQEINPDDNMIADDASFGFEDGTTGKWYFGWNNGGTFVASAPGYGSDYCMALTANPGNPEEYTAQLNCPLKDGEAIQIGGEYEISFWAKTDTEGDHITPGAGAWPNPEWNNSKPAELTTNWQKFTYTLVADESNTAADGSTNIYFNYGKLTGTAYVDRVSVVCTKNPETAINGVEINKASSVRYNLNGQAVGSDYKGTVIEGGKKFIVK